MSTKIHEITPTFGTNFRHKLAKSLAKRIEEVFKEFASNSFDGSGHNFWLNIDPDKEIVMIDDGKGMDKSGIEDFVRMGESKKRYDEESVYREIGRMPIGQFGIATELRGFLGKYSLVETWMDGNKISLEETFEKGDFFVGKKMPIRIYAGDNEMEHGTRITISDLLVRGYHKTFSLDKVKDALTWEMPIDRDDFDIIVNGEKLVRPVLAPDKYYHFSEQLSLLGNVQGHIYYFSDNSPKYGAYVYIRGRAVGDINSLGLHKAFHTQGKHFLVLCYADGLHDYIGFDRSQFVEYHPAVRELHNLLNKEIRQAASLERHVSLYRRRQIASQIVPGAVKKVEEQMVSIPLRTLLSQSWKEGTEEVTTISTPTEAYTRPRSKKIFRKRERGTVPEPPNSASATETATTVDSQPRYEQRRIVAASKPYASPVVSEQPGPMSGTQPIQQSPPDPPYKARETPAVPSQDLPKRTREDRMVVSVRKLGKHEAPAYYRKDENRLIVNSAHPLYTVLSTRASLSVLQDEFMFAASVAIPFSRLGPGLESVLKERDTMIAKMASEIFDRGTRLFHIDIESGGLFNDYGIYSIDQVVSTVQTPLEVLSIAENSGSVKNQTPGNYLGSDLNNYLTQLQDATPAVEVILRYEESKQTPSEEIKKILEQINHDINKLPERSMYLTNMGVDKPFYIVRNADKQTFLTDYVTGIFVEGSSPETIAPTSPTYIPLKDAKAILRIGTKEFFTLLDSARLTSSHIFHEEDGQFYVDVNPLRNLRKTT